MRKALIYTLYALLLAIGLTVALLPAQWIGTHQPAWERDCYDHVGRPVFCNIPEPTYDWGYWHAEEFGYRRATLTQMEMLAVGR